MKVKKLVIPGTRNWHSRKYGIKRSRILSITTYTRTYISKPSDSTLRQKSYCHLWVTVMECIGRNLAGSWSISSRKNTSELEVYPAPLISFDQRESSYEWWQVNNPRFPRLANIARQFLSAPPTSVASERLLTNAGSIYTDRPMLVPYIRIGQCWFHIY